jgi:hypothetical protein
MINFLLTTTLGRWVSAVGVAVVLLGAGLTERHFALGREYQRGWDEALLTASRVLPVAQEHVTVASKQTDSSAVKVQRTAPVVRRMAEAALAHLDTAPAPVADVTPAPEDTTVRTALQACVALTNDCEKLRADIMTERAARESLTVSTNAVIVATQDTARALGKRPTWKKAAGLGVLGALLGWCIGGGCR